MRTLWGLYETIFCASFLDKDVELHDDWPAVMQRYNAKHFTSRVSIYPYTHTHTVADPREAPLLEAALTHTEGFSLDLQCLAKWHLGRRTAGIRDETGDLLVSG